MFRDTYRLRDDLYLAAPLVHLRLIKVASEETTITTTSFLCVSLVFTTCSVNLILPDSLFSLSIVKQPQKASS